MVARARGKRGGIDRGLEGGWRLTDNCSPWWHELHQREEQRWFGPGVGAASSRSKKQRGVTSELGAEPD
jgi:hypothetical protein